VPRHPDKLGLKESKAAPASTQASRRDAFPALVFLTVAV